MTLTRLSLGISTALALGAGQALAQELDVEADAPPTTPPEPIARAYSDTAAGVAWSPSTDDAGVRAYEVTLDGDVVQESDARSYIDFSLDPATTYRVGVTAIDTAGQRSETAFVEFDTSGGGESASGPAPVEGLRASVYSSTALGLAWTRSEAFGLVHEVSRDGEVLGTTDGTSYIEFDLAPGDYVYAVVAIDRQGGRSEPVSLDVSTFAGMTAGDDITPDDMTPDDTTPGDGIGPDGEGVPGGGEPMPTVSPVEDSSTPVGTSILDIARGTDEDGDGVFEGAAEGLGTLVEALGAYPDLIDALDDESAELTVFAPTDDAFAAVDLTGASAADVENVLRFHVVSGTVLDAAAADGAVEAPLTLETAQGGTLAIVDAGDGTPAAVDAAGNVIRLERVVDSASNGVIYLIDSVLAAPPTDTASGDVPVDGESADEVPADGVPTDASPVDEPPTNETLGVDGTPPEEPSSDDTPSDAMPADGTPEDELPEGPVAEGGATPTGDSVLDVARGTDEDGDGVFDGAAPAFGTLVRTLGDYPDLLDALDDESAALTVFAPTDSAFAAADLAGLDAASVGNVLQYHVVSGTVLDAAALAEGPGLPITLTTVQGGTLEIVDAGDGRLAVIDAAGNSITLDAVVDAASNGVIYPIDAVFAAPPAVP